MNQDQIKNLLLKLNSEVPDFAVVLTGKKSNKVHGLYKPDSKEILIHNRNFVSEMELVYTAIHEFAHHVQFSSANRPTSHRSHTSYYWDLFHRLLRKAEELGLYHNVFLTEPDFIALTDKIKRDYLEENGQLMKNFGQLLLEASELCQKHHARFEDYMDRILCISRSTAKTLIQSFSQDIDPRVGFDQMKTLVSVKDPQIRQELTKKIQDGFSPDMIKKEIQNSLPATSNEQPLPQKELHQLIQNRDYLKKKIEALQVELKRLENAIQEKQEVKDES